MRQLVSHIPLTACALATALLVSACGGGDASAPPTEIGSSGLAVDDYISGATVVCDANGNGASDAGEATTTTDSTGFFKFAATCASTLVVTGGTNIDTQLPFVGKLMAPAGSTMVTPLTTLMAEGMTLDQINAALGLPAGTNVTMLDPARKVGGELDNADLFRKTLAVQQVLQKTAETLAALAGSTDVAAMYSQAAAAMATVLRGDASLVLVAGDAMDSDTVSAVVQAAATRVNADVNAASLAQVMAGALTVQANQILAADGAQAITDTTTAQQGSSAIQAFVLAKETDLKEAPTVTTAELASALTDQVSGGEAVTPPPPPPPNPANLLTNGDFSNGAAGWDGNALDVRTEGGNSYSFANVTDAGQPFDVNLKYVLNIPNSGVKYKLRFKASSDRSRTLIAGIGLNEDPWTNATETVNLTTIQQTFELSLTSNFASSNSRVFFDMGAAVGTVVIDDVELLLETVAPVPAEDCSTSTEQCISFSEADAGANPFEGLVAAEVITDPTSSTNKLLKMVKGPSGQPWAGATVFTAVATDGDKTIRTVPTIGLSASKSVTVRAYSGAAVGTKVTLKLENALGGGDVYAEVRTTKQNEWETLTFDFASPARGTVNSSVSYNMASLFPAFSEIANTQAALVSDTTFYFDELKYAVATVTPPPTVPVEGTDTVVADFDTAVPVVRGPDSGGTGFITTTDIPAGGGTGAVLGVLRSGGQPWALNVLEAPVQFTEERKTLSARVYSPTAGIRMAMKVEGTGGAVEVDANETVAVGWQTLTWTFNAAKTDVGAYNLLVILPNFLTVDPEPGKTYYFDDIKLLAAAASGGGGGGGGATIPGAEMGAGGPQTLIVASGDVKTGDGGNTMFVAGEGIFAVNYVGSAETTPPFNLAGWPNAKTANFGSITGISGGDIGYFQDDVNLSNSSQKIDEGGWVAGTAIAPLGVPNFFRYFVLKGPVSNDAYMGTYVNAPNNGTVDVSGFSKLKIKVWGPAPMFERSFNPVLQITLVGPKVAGCTTGSGGSEITQNLTANLKNGAGGAYTLSLNGFTANGLCGTDSGAANVLAKLARVVVTVPGTSFNYTEIDGGNYTTGVNLGPIGFTNN